MEIKDVIPKNENVLVEIEKLEEVVGNVYVGNQNAVEKDAHPTEFYVGRVHSFGEDAKSNNQCPELEIGKLVIFSQWSGHTTPTKDGYTKIIPGYNIVAFTDSLDMNIDEVNPTNDRVLVQIVQEEKVKDGIFNTLEDDPRESVTQKGIILRCAINAEQYKKGDIVFFEPTVGNLIVNRPSLQLKTLNSKSILFTI
jgi:co-chaperonin GroES (HSP10)